MKPFAESISAVLAGYERDAESLVARFETVSPRDKLRPVADLIPAHPSRIADIGAGSGVDAAWFAAMGHRVLAIEPVQALRTAGARLHASERIEWLDDALPALARTLALATQFDLILVSAVWQHLEQGLQQEALTSIARLLKPGGRVVISIRNGPGAPSRPTYPGSAECVIEMATGLGLRTLRREQRESMQQGNRDAGVTWDWLVFERFGSTAAVD